MNFIGEILDRTGCIKELRNFDPILSYWLINNQEKFLNLENYIMKPLYCQVKIVKAFYKDVLEEIMDDRFKMF